MCALCACCGSILLNHHALQGVLKSKKSSASTCSTTLEGVQYTVHTQCGTVHVVGYFGDFIHALYSELHVFPSCKRYYHCTYCTVPPYGFTHVSFMASCGHHCHLHPIKW